MVKLNTSIILPSKFLLSPFPRSNVGIGTATVWPIAGVPSSFLLLATIVFACFSWLSMAPERWQTLLESTLQFGHNNPSSHEVPHKNGCICHIWYKCKLLRFPCHKHSTSRYPEIKKRCFYTKTTLMAMLLNVYLTIYVIFFHAQLQVV